MRSVTRNWPPLIFQPPLKRSGTERRSRRSSSVPTHAEAKRITDAIRDGLKAQGKLGKERVIAAWVPSHLTDAEKSDPTQYDAGDMVQFHQNAKGYNKGSRLVVGEGATPPTELANRFELYHPAQLAVAVGDRVRVTSGGKTKDGKHKLSNGALLTVEGFTKRGDIVVDHGWVIDRDFGHMAYGYCITSHASQGVTVDKVFIGMSSESFGATNQRTGYVALDERPGSGGSFHGRSGSAIEGSKPARRSVVGNRACRGRAGEADAAGPPVEAHVVCPWRFDI